MNSEIAPTNLTKEQLINLGVQYAKGFDYKGGPTRFAESLGGKVSISDWERNIPDHYIDVKGPKDFEIHLSPFLGPHKRDYDIVCFLAFYFLHTLMGTIPGQFSYPKGYLISWEIQKFTLGFLIDPSAFAFEYDQRKNTSERERSIELMGLWGVPTFLIEMAEQEYIPKPLSEIDQIKEILNLPLTSSFDEVKSSIIQIQVALNDVIRRPMGVIPASAESFVTHQSLDEAEIRRYL